MLVGLQREEWCLCLTLWCTCSVSNLWRLKFFAKPNSLWFVSYVRFCVFFRKPVTSAYPHMIWKNKLQILIFVPYFAKSKKKITQTQQNAFCKLFVAFSRALLKGIHRRMHRYRHVSWPLNTLSSLLPSRLYQIVLVSSDRPHVISCKSILHFYF